MLRSNDTKLCECGCEEIIATIDNQGRPRRFKNHHFFKSNKFRFPRESNGHWKGGKVIDAYGYILIQCKGHPKGTKKGNYVREHVLVMESHIGRYMKDGEVIHHKNGDKKDNRLENLILLGSNKEHIEKYHSTRKKNDLAIVS